MVAQPSIALDAVAVDRDRRFVIYGANWDAYVAMRRVLDRIGHVRITYLEGTMELMSPSSTHEEMKTRIARLVEAYAGVRGIPLNGFGQMTYRKKAKERGLEPDECYCLGRSSGSRPDLAIEIVTSKSAIKKLRVYEGLGVPEVWIWEKGKLGIYVLSPSPRARGRGPLASRPRERASGYQTRDRSLLLPGLDLGLLMRFAAEADQTRAAERFRAALLKAAGPRLRGHNRAR